MAIGGSPDGGFWFLAGDRLLAQFDIGDPEVATTSVPRARTRR
jgi:hypothetical protein